MHPCWFSFGVFAAGWSKGLQNAWLTSNQQIYSVHLQVVFAVCKKHAHAALSPERACPAAAKCMPHTADSTPEADVFSSLHLIELSLGTFGLDAPPSLHCNLRPDPGPGLLSPTGLIGSLF